MSGFNNEPIFSAALTPGFRPFDAAGLCYSVPPTLIKCAGPDAEFISAFSQ